MFILQVNIVDKFFVGECGELNLYCNFTPKTKSTVNTLHQSTLIYGMKSPSVNDNNANLVDGSDEITKQDIINLATLKNINLIDKNYAKNHITIRKKKIMTSYEIEINDIDGKKHQLIFELKTYKK